MSKKNNNTYTDEFISEIAFPLGGIGTGSIALAGNGQLIDWEINNKPNRVSLNGCSNFAIKVEDQEKVLDTRILQGDDSKDLMGYRYSSGGKLHYGKGPHIGTLSGLKHFDSVAFKGEFPIAELSFIDKSFPGQVNMQAFNPFIPSDDKNSSIPSAFFTFNIRNSTDKKLKYTVALSVTNPLDTKGLNFYKESDDIKAIVMESKEQDNSKPGFGNVCLATDGDDVSYQEYWYRGGWFDSLTMFINDFSQYGGFDNRSYNTLIESGADTSVLAVSIEVEPGEAKDIRFNLSWYIPNVWKSWPDWDQKEPRKKQTDWHNYYAKLYSSSLDVSKYSFLRWDLLYSNTEAFRNALFSSDMPEAVIDAIQGNIAILKSSTCLRLTNGEFYAWEGVERNFGSCEGTCQHVWNYAYALPFLFPNLERGARETELNYNLEKSGELHFRVMLPLGAPMHPFRACVDGQMGTVMKCYREWKISGDNSWLRAYWYKIKACIEYAWSEENPDKWDVGKKGYLDGRQHHTLDVELFGVTSWLTGFYHGALLAGAEMAEAVGEFDTAKDYRDIFSKGYKWIEENTFNGAYYVQKIDLTDKSIVDEFGDEESIGMQGGYWDEETGEIKYQIADGCEIDQLVAQWHADLMGLPQIFNQKNRKIALETLYKTNFVSMRDLHNPCRIFAANNEKGLIMCNWEEGAIKPKIPIPYTQEVMTGFEYAAAANMLQCDLEEQALEIVEAVRDRYDGRKRNPWAEIECGASYSRAMASYSFLLIYSGFQYDMTVNKIGFIPKKHGQYFWSIDGAWGSVLTDQKYTRFEILYGKVTVNEFVHHLNSVKGVYFDDKEVPFTQKGNIAYISVTMGKGSVLKIIGK